MQDNDLPQIGTPMQTDETRASIGRHLATFNLFREADHSLQITIAEAKGVQAELGGSGAPLALCAMNALYSAVDSRRGKPAFAAPPAVEREGDRWRFARYLNGIRMAEGVAVTLADDLDTAIAKAVKLCPKAPSGCQILVLTHAKGSPTLHPSDREEGLREAAQAVVDNASRAYRSRGKERYIEDESGELMMLVPHEDWYRLEHSLAAILALSGSLAPEGGDAPNYTPFTTRAECETGAIDAVRLLEHAALLYLTYPPCKRRVCS